MTLTFVAAIVYLTIGVLLFLLGLLIYRENAAQRVNRVTGVLLFFAALAPIMGAFGLIVFKIYQLEQLNLEFFRRLFLLWELFFPQLLYFSLVFPTERKIVRSFPKIVYFIYLPHIFHFIIVLLFKSPESIISLIQPPVSDSVFNLILKPLSLFFNFSLGLISYFYEFHLNFFAVINLIYVLLAVYFMHQSFQNLPTPRIKKQVGLVIWGIRSSVGLYVIAFILPRLLPIHTSDNVVYLITIVALLIGTISIAWAMIKYQFLDISSRITREFLFSICFGIITAVFLLAFYHLKKLVPDVLGFDVPIVEVVFIIFAVLAFHPMINNIQRFLTQLFGKDRTDFRTILESLSHDILTIPDVVTLKQKITSVLTESLMLENVHLIIENGSGAFEIEYHAENKSIKHTFLFNSEFITLMRQLERPVSIEELMTLIDDAEEKEILNRLNCYLLIPLNHRSELKGILCLGNKLTRTSFSAEDASLLNLLSGQIAIALENIELYKEKIAKQRIEEEISLAQEIQQMLLPSHVPQGKNFEISAMNIPSKEVGGDYYDFIELDERRIGIAIGDIAGKGIPGALLMSNLQAALRASAWQYQKPELVINKINNQLAHTTSAEKYATFFYGIFDTQKLTFTFSNAGHNYPIIKTQDGSHCFLSEGGLVIGVQPNFPYQSSQVKLSPGDTIVFYTDGITEAINVDVEEFGERKLIDIILQNPFHTAEELRNLIYEEMVRFTRGTPQYDDLTLIVLRVL
ncbi:hypothetical protein B6D60_01260 [candidate division KSB1 bacterium 4484_87]|nr:MAG: hypothetical protein B6D60_01260 [candidate division KSB1 bacterium 4484_87]